MALQKSRIGISCSEIIPHHTRMTQLVLHQHVFILGYMTGESTKMLGKTKKLQVVKAKASIIVYEWDLINTFNKYKMGKRCQKSDVDSYFYHSNARVWIQFRKLHNYAFWNKSHSHNHKYRTLTFAISVFWAKVTKPFLKPWNHYCSVGTLREQTSANCMFL